MAKVIIQEKKGKFRFFFFQNPDIQIKPGESTVHEVSFQWLHFRTSLQTQKKIQLSSFHLNDPTLEFHLQTQKVRTTLHGITNGTTSYHRKVLLSSFHLNGGSHCLISSTYSKVCTTSQSKLFFSMTKSWQWTSVGLNLTKQNKIENTINIILTESRYKYVLGK